jgi:fatty-acyl-CoA synthase
VTLRTIAEVLELHAGKSPSRLAYFDARTGDGRTFAELNVRSARLANALLGAGLVPGSRVAAFMRTSIAYVELYLAAAKAGLVVASINEKFKADEVRYLLESSGAEALVVSKDLLPIAEQVIGPGDLRLLIVDGPPSRPGVQSLEALYGSGSTTRCVGPGADDLFMLAYTSGTTGFPKGAMLSHRSVLAIVRMNAVSYRLPIGSVGAYRGSMSFVASICAFLFTHLYLGGTVVILDSGDPQFIVDSIGRHGANYTSVPTPLLADFATALHGNPAAAASLTTVLHSGSKARPDVLRAFAEVAGDRLVEGWGMTEHSGGLATATTRADVTGRSESALDVFESVGRAVPEAAVEIVGPDGLPLPHDGAAVGDLLIRSPAIAMGYWSDPEATAAAFADGAYRTGDLGSIDPAGYVYVSERRTDLIISGGINVYPSEVERVIGELSDVVEVSVLGMDHVRWGQTVVAAVVTVPGSRITEADVVEHCRSKLASYKKPTRVVFFDALPRNASDKVTRPAVRLEIVQRDREGAAP